MPPHPQPPYLDPGVAEGGRPTPFASPAGPWDRTACRSVAAPTPPSPLPRLHLALPIHSAGSPCEARELDFPSNLNQCPFFGKSRGPGSGLMGAAPGAGNAART